MKIAIDAGHYRYTSGKRCLKSIDPEETREWELNSHIAGMLANRLSIYDCEVIRVDDVTGEKEVTLTERCALANKWGADVYISIHHNAGINGGSGGGTVVFWYSADNTREEQAKRLYEAVTAHTGLKGNRANPVVFKGYYVLAHTSAQSFLLENGFMDSTTDTPIILTNEHAEKTAEGIEKFLVDEYGLKKRNIYEEEINEMPKWARATIEKLVDKEFLKGDGEHLNLSDDLLRTLVILDRTGVFDINSDIK